MVNRTLTKFWEWALKDRSPNADALDPQGRMRVDLFFADLAGIANAVDRQTYCFCDMDQEMIGRVQLQRQGGEVTIHRIWAITAGQGHGSRILKQICELADRHGVILKLAVNPLGVRPYPMSSSQLHSWYYRNGFEGRRKMIRLPKKQDAISGE